VKVKIGEPVVVTAPEEPGERSAVLDAQGMVFQRFGDVWHAADPTGGAGDWRELHLNWPTLLVIRGPVIPLHLT
jgi:hypothetical protein